MFAVSCICPARRVFPIRLKTSAKVTGQKIAATFFSSHTRLSAASHERCRSAVSFSKRVVAHSAVRADVAEIASEPEHSGKARPAVEAIRLLRRHADGRSNLWRVRIEPIDEVPEGMPSRSQPFLERWTTGEKSADEVHSDAQHPSGAVQAEPAGTPNTEPVEQVHAPSIVVEQKRKERMHEPHDEPGNAPPRQVPSALDDTQRRLEGLFTTHTNSFVSGVVHVAIPVSAL